MKYLFIIFSIIVSSLSFAQVTVWSEDFDANGGAGSNWGTLNQNIGTQGITANRWYISGQECGNAVGMCGSVCGGDFSLHVSSTTVGDLGAAYDASSACLPGCFICDLFGGPPFCTDVTTNKRSQSQNINTIGHTGLTLNFNYIELGQGNTDNAVVQYSINGGASWLTLFNTAKPPLGACSPQGTWTAFSMALPATCENITNLRIAFRWQNNADGIGTDPSFAVDDITITKAVGLPITLLYFNASNKNNDVKLEWVTETEINNDYFTIERSDDAIEYKPIINTKGGGNTTGSIYYSEIDYNLPPNRVVYYRLKQTDFDGTYTYSNVIPIKTKEDDIIILQRDNQINISSKSSNQSNLEICDISGKLIYSSDFNQHESLNTTKFQSGIYIVKITSQDKSIVRKMKF